MLEAELRATHLFECGELILKVANASQEGSDGRHVEDLCDPETDLRKGDVSNAPCAFAALLYTPILCELLCLHLSAAG